MRLKIKEIELKNFQGLRHFSAKLNGLNASIYGANGTGKTTVYNAFCWLMFGKPSTVEKNFTPQTVDTHGLEHTAEVTLMLDGDTGMNPPELTLCKSYHETYKTKRNSGEKTFTGYTTDYYIDRVPVKESDYNKKVSELCDSDTAKVLSRPEYFLSEMKVADRREMLVEAFGAGAEIEPDDELKAVLGSYTVDYYQKLATASLKEVRAKVQSIPLRIDEAEAAKPSIVGDTVKAAAELADAESQKAILQKKLSTLDLTVSSDLIKKKAELEGQLQEKRIAHEAQQRQQREEWARRLDPVKTELQEKRLEIQKLKSQSSLNSLRIDELTVKRKRLLESYEQAKGRVFDVETVCPYCKQELPADRIEEAQKNFNLQKSQDLERIVAQGTSTKNELEPLKAERIELDNRISELELEAATLKAEIDSAPPYEGELFGDTEQFRIINSELGDIILKISDMEGATASMRKDTEADIADVNAKIDRLRTILANAETVKRQDQRIAELKQQQKELAKQAESMERGLWLCEQYSAKKASALTDRINGHFDTLKFRLFREQVNGGLADDCEALIPCGGVDVPYKSANNASRVNAGLELADVLGEAWGVVLPVFVDNAEGVTSLKETKGQQIRLYVSDSDTTLKVEV